MTTSGETTWTQTEIQIVSRALRLLGVGTAGETLSAEETSDGVAALNALVKAWQAKGLGLWTRTEGTMTLVAAQQSYTMGGSGTPDFASRPLKIESCRVKDSSDREIPMAELSRQEYFNLPLKSATGIPTQFYYDPQLNAGKLYVWPTLQTGQTRTLAFTYRRTLEDFSANGDTPDFPVEWINALTYNLAVDLSPEYPGATISPIVTARASEYLADLRGFDAEDSSVYFQPDPTIYR